MRKFSLVGVIASLLSIVLIACQQQSIQPPNNSSSQPIQSHQLQVLKRYPHSQDHYTQGLEYVGENVVLESTGLVGKSWIRWVDLSTGEVGQKQKLSVGGGFGEGSTKMGDLTYYLTYQKETVVIYDSYTFAELDRQSYSGEGWGLTNDGTHLIMSNGSNQLFFRDPQTFKATHRLDVTSNGAALNRLNELEYVNGYIYANVYMRDIIVKIDAQSGQVVKTYNVKSLWDEAKNTAQSNGQPLERGDVPNGIAYVPERNTFLLTGKRWPTIFEVKF